MKVSALIRGPARLAALATVAAGGLLWGSLEVLLRSAWPLDWMRERIVSQASRTFGADVTVEQLRRGDARLSFELVGLDVRGSAGEEFLEIPRAEGRLGWRTLLGGRPVVESLILHDPVVSMVDGVLAARAVDELGDLRSISELEVRQFELHNGRLDWNGQRFPLAARGSGLSVRSEFDPVVRSHRIEASVAELECSAPFGVVFSDAAAKASLVVGAAGVEVTQATLRSRGLEASLEGSLLGPKLETVELRYTLRAAVPMLAAAAGFDGGQWGGELEFAGDVRRDASAVGLRHSGSIRSTGVELPHVDADVSVSGKFSGSGTSLEVSDLSGRVLDGSFTSAISVAGSFADWTLAMSGQADAISLAAASGAAGVAATPWDGLIGMRWKSSGSRSGGVQTDVALEVLPIAGPSQFPLGAAASLTHSTITGTAEIEDFSVRTPNLRAAGHGRIALDGSGTLRLELAADSRGGVERALAIAQRGAALPKDAPEGFYGYSGAVLWENPTFAGLRFDGTFWINDIVARSQPWGRLQIDGTLRREGLYVRKGRLEDGAAQVTFSGKLPLVEDGAADIAVAAKGLDAAKLSRTVGLELPVAGTLDMRARLLGTLSAPQVQGTVEVDAPTCFGERFDRLEARVEYLPDGLAVRDAVLLRGASTVRARASYVPATGDVEFAAASGLWAVGGFTWAGILLPGIIGDAQFDLRAEGRVSEESLLTDLALHGSWTVTELRAGEVHLGDWRGSLRSDRTDPELHLSLDADLFDGHLRGTAQMGRAGSAEYRGTLEYANINPMRAFPLPGLVASGARGAVSGSADFEGLSGEEGFFSLSGVVDRVELSVPAADGTAYRVANVFPLRWGVREGLLVLDAMSVASLATSFQVDGTIGLHEPRDLDLAVLGDISLAEMQGAFGALRQSGSASLSLQVRGTLGDPLAEGTVALRGASLEYPGSPLRVSNLNGTIVLEGTQARLDSLAGQSGGGHVRFDGTAQLRDSEPQYRLQAEFDAVRVNYPPAVSSVIDGRLTLAGAGTRSLLNGQVLVSRLSTEEGLSIGELFAAMRPPAAAVASGPFLEGMQVAVDIGAVQQLPFETQLVRDVEASIDMSVMGTVAAPALIGEVQIVEGEVRMLGTHYRINRGQVRFLGPGQAEPVLDFDLETRIRDVDLELVLSGPLGNLNLSYRSDPPLPFHDLVDLVAVGKEPTIDPSISSRRRLEQQSLVQTGADAILSQAISRPVSKRLQRFFGVSRLKVDPQIGGLESNPSARLSTEQQIADDITLIYSYDLSSAQQQAIRIEWNPDRKWSFIVTRDQNGIIGSDILFKLRRP